MGWFANLWRRCKRGPTQRPDLHLIIYTRADCRLCDDAWELLRDFRDRHGFILEACDVDASAELVHAYGNCVPVVTINGQVRFRGRVNPVLLRRMIEG